MRVVLDSAVCEKYGFTLEEVMTIILMMNHTSYKEIYDSLKDRYDLFNPVNKDYLVIPLGLKRTINQIIVDSDKNIIKKGNFYSELAKKMRKLFPEGKKEGTNDYWRSSLKDIENNLKKVEKKFEIEFNEEDALAATKEYIDSFHGDYRFMRCLKYFIYKNDPVKGEISDFASYLENAGQNNMQNNNAFIELR